MWVKRNGFSLKTVTALLGVGGGKDLDRGRCHSRQAGGQAGKNPASARGREEKQRVSHWRAHIYTPPPEGKLGANQCQLLSVQHSVSHLISSQSGLQSGIYLAVDWPKENYESLNQPIRLFFGTFQSVDFNIPFHRPSSLLSFKFVSVSQTSNQSVTHQTAAWSAFEVSQLPQQIRKISVDFIVVTLLSLS